MLDHTAANAEGANGPRRVLGEEAIVEAVDEEINLLQARQSLRIRAATPLLSSRLVGARTVLAGPLWRDELIGQTSAACASAM